jgi:hypothetical protein
MDKNNAAAIPPLTAPAMLTDEQILTALASIAHEVPARLPPGWSKFARAIEREVAKAAPAAPVQTAQDCMECGGSGEMFGGFYCDECNGSGKVAAPVQVLTEQALSAITAAIDVLDSFGNLPDYMIHPAAWSQYDTEAKIMAARQALIELRTPSTGEASKDGDNAASGSDA